MDIFEEWKDSISNCDCLECKLLCKTRVGRFFPEQVIELEKFLGKTLEEMMGKEVCIDYWASETQDVDALLLTPNVIGNDSPRLPFLPFGRCVFLNEQELCGIYEVRPLECAIAKHDIKSSPEFELLIGLSWAVSPLLKDWKEKLTFIPTEEEIENFNKEVEKFESLIKIPKKLIWTPDN